MCQQLECVFVRACVSACVRVNLIVCACMYLFARMCELCYVVLVYCLFVLYHRLEVGYDASTVRVQFRSFTKPEGQHEIIFSFISVANNTLYRHRS